MKKFLASFLCMIVFQSSVIGDEVSKTNGTSMDLEVLKNDHEKRLVEAENPLKKLNAAVKAELEKYGDAVQKQGNLDELISTQNAIKELETATDAWSGQSQKLRLIEKTYRSNLKLVTIEVQKKTLDAHREFASNLKDLTKKLTVSGRIDEAMLVKKMEDNFLDTMKQAMKQDQLKAQSSVAEPALKITTNAENKVMQIKPILVTNKFPKKSPVVSPAAFVLESDQSKGSASIKFKDSSFNSPLHPIRTANLVLIVTGDPYASTRDTVVVMHNGKIVGKKTGASRFEKISIPLDVAAIVDMGKNEIELNLTCGNDAVEFHGTGEKGLYLEVSIQD